MQELTLEIILFNGYKTCPQDVENSHPQKAMWNDICPKKFSVYNPLNRPNKERKKEK